MIPKIEENKKRKKMEKRKIKFICTLEEYYFTNSVI
jgi:hypothetical protein